MFGDEIRQVCKACNKNAGKENPPFWDEKGGNIEWFLDNAYFVRYVKHFGVSARDDVGTFF